MLTDQGIKDEVFSMLEERRDRIEQMLTRLKLPWHILHWDLRFMVSYTDVLLVIDYCLSKVYPSDEHEMITQALEKIEGVTSVFTLNMGFRARVYFVRLLHTDQHTPITQDAHWHFETTYVDNPNTYVINFINR